jgi:hypothetical protein
MEALDVKKNAVRPLEDIAKLRRANGYESISSVGPKDITVVP